MAAFEYVAVDTEGRRTKGVISAETARAARRELQRRKLMLLKLAPAAEKRGGLNLSGLFNRGGRLGSGELVLATRQLALLVSASTPVEEALNAVALQSDSAAIRRTLLSVRDRVVEGRRLSEAMSLEGRAFSPLYLAVVSAGEAAGALGAVMERLADYLERSQTMQRKMMAALVYPCVLFVVAIAVVTALMVFVVPRVVEQFSTLGQDLPLLTQVLIAISGGMRDWGWLIALALAVGSFVFARALKQDDFRRAVDRTILKLPLAGRLIRDAGAARFARTFATLSASGATVLDSLKAARATAPNMVLRDAVTAAAADVQEGGALSTAMRKTSAFPPLMVHMAASGENSGELPAMFDKAADYLENEFETVTQVAMNLLEPAIIILMGGLVTLIILAIMLPILQLNTSAMF